MPPNHARLEQMRTLVGTWPVDDAGAGRTDRSGTVDVVGSHRRRFALASVTKLLTATAVLVAAQEEIVELDEPAGPPGATVRHLLAHASGLAPDRDEPIARPATRRIYSNAGFELLGRLVSGRADMAFAEYVHQGVCTPLSMGDTVLEGSPAKDATSTVDDLLRFSAELLAPGRVLAPEVLAAATTPSFADLAGVLPGYGRQDPNPWGLGFELRGGKAPHWTPETASRQTFGHFGQSGTFLWVDPSVGVACVALSDRRFGPWAIESWPRLGAAALRCE